MSASNPDPHGVDVISRGDILHGLAAADDPVVRWLWSQLSLGGTSDPLDPPPVHRLALGYPGYTTPDDHDRAEDGGDSDAAA